MSTIVLTQLLEPICVCATSMSRRMTLQLLLISNFHKAPEGDILSWIIRNSCPHEYGTRFSHILKFPNSASRIFFEAWFNITQNCKDLRTRPARTRVIKLRYRHLIQHSMVTKVVLLRMLCPLCIDVTKIPKKMKEEWFILVHSSRGVHPFFLAPCIWAEHYYKTMWWRGFFSSYMVDKKQKSWKRPPVFCFLYLSPLS